MRRQENNGNAGNHRNQQGFSFWLLGFLFLAISVLLANREQKNPEFDSSSRFDDSDHAVFQPNPDQIKVGNCEFGENIKIGLLDAIRRFAQQQPAANQLLLSYGMPQFEILSANNDSFSIASAGVDVNCDSIYFTPAGTGLVSRQAAQATLAALIRQTLFYWFVVERNKAVHGDRVSPQDALLLAFPVLGANGKIDRVKLNEFWKVASRSVEKIGAVCDHVLDRPTQQPYDEKNVELFKAATRGFTAPTLSLDVRPEEVQDFKTFLGNFNATVSVHKQKPTHTVIRYRLLDKPEVSACATLVMLLPDGSEPVSGLPQDILLIKRAMILTSLLAKFNLFPGFIPELCAFLTKFFGTKEGYCAPVTPSL